MTLQTPSITVPPADMHRAPHPGFPVLVKLHVQSLAREFPVAWIVFGTAILGLPALALAADLSVTAPGAAGFGIVRMSGGILAAQTLTLFVAFFWPDAVWRNLPPDGRQALDALPVDRLWHRLARVLAGFSLPLLMTLSVFLAQVIAGARLEGASAMSLTDAVIWPAGPQGSWVTVPAVAGAYLFGSALGLLGMRVILTTLLALVVYAFVPVALLLGLGLETLANGYTEIMIQGSWSPVRVLLLGFRAEAPDTLPVLGWLAILGVISHRLAGRHGRR